jgi:L-rhamnose-H+ transport protein
MNVLGALLYVIVAGVMNGSFALPTKHITRWHFENIWLNYSIWAFLILPWVILFAIDPHAFSVYQHVPRHTLAIMFIGGVLFGVGQVCFALALNMIGFGLGFVLNIGLGTALGFLLPLVFLHPDHILTPFGIVTLIGTALIIVGLLYSFHAGRLRDEQLKQQQKTAKATYPVGVLLAIIAGLFSAGQNFCFAATANMQTLALHMGVNNLAAANIMWPGFLICTFVPYALYMLYLHSKNQSYKHYKGKHSLRYSPMALLMAIFWYGSLILYSKASLVIGSLGPIVGWPLFMVLIILTSSFWGWRHKEWAGVKSETKSMAIKGIGFLVVAVIVLAVSVGLSN